MRINLARFTLVAIIAGASPALAQSAAERLSVSGTGVDSGTCARAAPCKTFAYALTQAPAGGEIVAVDTADYGPVNITKSINISAGDGATAIIHGSGTSDGVTVNAGAGAVVNLRGLSIENVPTGLNISSGTVNLERSTIDGGTFGIIVAGAGRTTVSDTIITGPTDSGIFDQTSGSTIVLDRVSLAGGGNAAIRVPNASLTMTDSTIVGWATGLLLPVGSAFVKRSVIAGASSTGISGGGTLYLDTTTITGCATGVTGAFTSYGNNNIVANTTNITGPKTTVQPQVVRSGARNSRR